MVNARAETVHDTPWFSTALRARRCLVPANGWFEWQRTGHAKQPYFLARADGSPLSFAARWECWNRGQASLASFTIITTAASPGLADIHPRQPVIVDPDRLTDWLDPSSPMPRLFELLCEPHAGPYERRAISSNVRKDPNGRRADVVVYHAAPALVATLDRDEEFVEVPRVSGADHAATLLRSRSMCQDYGEHQKLESARPMSILLERLKPTARRGSKPRCHCLTHGPHDAVAARLADLVAPFASVTSSDDWRPKGFAHTAEAQLGYADQFLTADRRAALTQWWLAVPRRANTPNWDLVSTCQVAGQKQGLLLVEAKAHAGELSAAGKTLTKRPSANSAQNDQRIRAAIAEANTRLGGPAQGWHLTADTHYQMSNRFAWAWKLADLGVPVVLVYLGFLNADEMGNGAFHSGDDWDRCLRDHAQGVVPAAAWNRRLEVRAGSGALVPLVPLIQTAHISLTCLEARPDDD